MPNLPTTAHNRGSSPQRAQSSPGAAQSLTRTAREVAPGVHWLGVCMPTSVGDRILHSYNSCYLVVGDSFTLLIDTSAPNGWNIIESELERILDGRQLDFIFPTHPELPHAGNVSELIKRYSDLKLIGDLRNWHLYLPGEERRFRHVKEGESVDLGGRTLSFVPAVVHDLRNSLWAYDDLSRTLFVSDGYCYTHEHDPSECGLLDIEISPPPEASDTRHVIERALSFTKFGNAEVADRALRDLLAQRPVNLVAPAHGGVVTDPVAFTQVFVEGLRRSSAGAFDD